MNNKELAILLIETAELLTEGAVNTNNNIKRKKEKFLDRYDYDPKTETIKIGSSRVKVDVNSKKLGYDSNTYTLYINKDFFNLKNNDRRDAILKHELAHAKFHSSAVDPNLDRDKYITKPFMTNMKMLTKGDESTLRELYKINKDFRDVLNRQNTMERNAPDKKSKDARIHNYEKWEDKMNYKNSIHASPNEYEADKYASVNSSKKSVKKSIAENGKQLIKKNNKSHPDNKNDFNSKLTDNNKKRYAALDDKNIKSEPYKQK